MKPYDSGFPPFRQSRSRSAAIGVLLALIACGRAGNDSSNQAAAPSPDSIVTASSRIARSLVLHLPSGMAIRDSLLIVIDGDRQLPSGASSGDPYVHIIALGSDTVLRSLGKPGKGPSDFACGPRIVPAFDGNLWLWDQCRRRLSAVNLAVAIGQEGGGTPFQTMAAPNMDEQGVVVMRRGTVLATALDSAKQYLFVRHEEGQGALVVGSLVTGDQRNAEDLWIGYQNILCAAQTARSLIAVTYLRTGRIDILDTNGALVRRAAVSDSGGPELVKDSASGKQVFRQMNRGSKYYYGRCDASRRYLYAPYYGVRQDDQGRMPSRTFTDVHVFDWDGKLIGNIRLDHPTDNIAVDPVDSILYSTTGSDSTGVEIRATPIPARIRSARP